MVQGFAALLSSKKAIAGSVLVICATVLVALGRMPVAEWETFARWIFTVYAGAETVNGVAAVWKGASRTATNGNAKPPV